MKLLRILPLLFSASLAFAVRPDCTKFVSTAGAAAWGSCTSSGTTCSITTAFASATAGEHVCIKSGTYSLTDGLVVAHSGNATGISSGPTWDQGGNCPDCIVFEDYDAQPVTSLDVILNFPLSATSSSHWVITVDQNYVIIKGLIADGQQYAANGIMTQGSSGSGFHHVSFQGNYVRNVISGGIVCQHADYCNITGNIVWNAGANPNNITTYATSCAQGTGHNLVHAFGSYTGIHQVLANNIVASSFCHTTQHSDGGGYLLDNTDSTPSPWTLAVNNIMYGNGGRCMGANTNNALPVVTNFIFVNNTCYMNNLDLTLVGISINEYEDRMSNTGYWINNISEAWPGWSGAVYNWHQSGTVSAQVYFKNSWLNGINYSFTPSDPTQFLNINPGFASPPTYDPTAGLQWEPCGTTNCTPDPSTELASGAFKLTGASPAVNVGVDPVAQLTAGGAPAQVIADAALYVYSDITGEGRPQGVAFDLGAYEVPASQLTQATISGGGTISGTGTVQ